VIGPFSAHVRATRENARARAGTALEAYGFKAEGSRWIGNVHLSDGTSVRVYIALPASFPDALPEVFLQSKPCDHIAHIERSGKVCIARESGTLIDAFRPEDIVTEALSMARTILQNRSASDQPRELESEFLAYWLEPSLATMLSACPPETLTGPACLANLSYEGSLSLVAPSEEAARDWSLAVGKQIKATEDAFFVHLNSLPPPPAFGERMTLRRFLFIVDTNAARESTKKLNLWLKSHGIPATVVLSAPLVEEAGHVVFACALREFSRKTVARGEQGFRRGHVPKAIIVTRALDEPMLRMEVSRVDPAYVLPRGGADLRLRENTVAVVGCGSVGSYVAQALAAAGVGTLVLIDPEVLEAANIHRHVLGASHIRTPKVVGLEKTLRERFPHIRIRPFQKRIESILDEAPVAVLSADLIVFALGDETLELRLNTFLYGKVRRIHVWLEPLGVGSHVLSLAKDGMGCFSCLYRRDDSEGLVNMASLVEPGQYFQQSFAGCAGTFTPFGSLDAEQAALHASREAVSVLRGDRVRPSLLSWVASKGSFLAAGRRLSRRGKSLSEEVLNREFDFTRPGCPVCCKETG